MVRRLGSQAVALTKEPEERLVRKLSRAVCAPLTLPELSAEPICESRLENDEELDVLVLLDELSDELSEELSVELLVESSRLVSESYADCAPAVSPELMALKRLSTSLPSVLMPELSVVVDEVEALVVLVAASVAPVLGTA